MRVDENLEFYFDNLWASRNDNMHCKSEPNEEPSGMNLYECIPFDMRKDYVDNTHMDMELDVSIKSGYDDSSKMHTYVESWEVEEIDLPCMQVPDARSFEEDLGHEDKYFYQHYELQLHEK